MWMLAAFGYDTTAGAVQTETAITGLRAQGYSWADIAHRLGTSRQAAQQRFTSTNTSPVDADS